MIGTGTTIFTGNSSYNGGTTVSSGALEIGNGGTSGAFTGNVVDNAALIFNRSDTAAFDGTISGTGSVTQAGSGKTVLTAASTYLGGTVISGGILQLGNGGAAGSISGNVSDGACLSSIIRTMSALAGLSRESGRSKFPEQWSSPSRPTIALPAARP